MTQEDKELLLKDLCARLPYGVIIQYPNIFRPSEVIKRRFEEISHSLIGIDEFKININDDGIDIEYVKPYLRPMSSITDEEFNKYEELEWSGDFEHLSLPLLDWLNKKMFDYRGLIEKGLALEAPKDMYNLKEK